MEDISQKDRINAAISYFFLAPLLLLVKRNPNFSHAFVRAHAKTATKIIAAFFFLFIVYEWGISDFLASFTIPFLLVDGRRVFLISFFAIFFFILFRGARRAYSGKLPNVSLRDAITLSGSKDIFDARGMSDFDKILATLSFIPFLGIIIGAKHQNSITSAGAKAGTILALLYGILATAGGASSMFFLFLGVLCVVSTGVILFTNQDISYLSIFEKIPNLEEFYRILRTIPGYFLDIIKASFGKIEHLSFRDRYMKIFEKDRAFSIFMKESYESAGESVFSPIITAIPFANLVFFPSLCFSKSFRLVIAAGQGIVITILVALSFYFYGVFASETFFFLFPISILLARSETDPFYRIPGIYELYMLFGVVTFGLTNRARKMQEISKKEESVSYKV